jgi:kumamolisin
MLPCRTRRAAGLAGALALVMLLSALPTPASASPFLQASGLAQPVPVPLPAVLTLPWAERAGYNETVVADATDVAALTGPVDLELSLTPSTSAFFQSPSSGGQGLTTAEIASQYGVSQTESVQLAAYFAANGLRVAGVSPDRLSMSVQGSAGAVGEAFGTPLESGALNGATVTFPLDPPRLPAPFESWVDAVSGLASGTHRFLLPLVRDSARAAQGSPSTISPNDAREIYDVNGLVNLSGTSHWAAGEGIAVVLWGSGYSPQDLSNFWSQDYPSQFPVPSVVAYPVNNAPYPSAASVNDPSNSTQEMSLDIEWSASQAPGATIDAVYAPDGPASAGYSPSDSDMEDAINEAINSIPGVTVVSMSFASSDGADPPFEATLEQLFAEAGQHGITVIAASGDNGGAAHGQNGGCGGGADPQYPAASPYVLAVGGTAPELATNALGGVTGLSSEPAWDGSGGGYASDFAAPSWQTVGSAAGPIASNGSHRGIPDVAGPAAQNMFYFNSATAYGSGTSFAAPMWAGLVAEMDAVRGRSLGFIDNRIYALEAASAGASSTGLVDITNGANCVTPATVGWDAATGWGSPRADALFEHLAGTYADLALTASTGSVPPGGSVTLTFQVTNASSRQAIPDVPVTLAASGTFPGPCTGSLTSANATTNASGGGSSTITVPSCYLGSSVSISATVDARGFIGENSTSVSVNLLGLAGLVAISETFPYNVILFAVIIGTATVLGLWLGGRRTRRRAARRAPAATTSAAAPPPPPALRTPPPRPIVPSSPPPPPAPVAPATPAPSITAPAPEGDAAGPGPPGPGA